MGIKGNQEWAAWNHPFVLNSISVVVLLSEYGVFWVGYAVDTFFLKAQYLIWRDESIFHR